MNENFFSLIESHLPADRSQCCIETLHGVSYSWDDLERGVAQIANLLTSLKLRPGSRVAAQVEKSPEALLLYLATLRAGYVFLPLNTAYREAEAAYFFDNAGPALIVCDPANRDWVARVSGETCHARVLTLSGTDLIAGKANGSKVLTNFFGGNPDNRSGIRVAAKNLDGDVNADIVVGDGSGNGSQVTGYLGKNFAGGAAPQAIGFSAFAGFTGGVFVG